MMRDETLDKNWQNALNPQLVQRLLRPVERPGLIRGRLAGAILSRAQNVSGRLPLLESVEQRHSSVEQLQGERAPIVYAQELAATESYAPAAETVAPQRPIVQAKAIPAPDRPTQERPRRASRGQASIQASVQQAVQSDPRPASGPAAQRPVIQAQAERASREHKSLPDWPARQRHEIPVSGVQTPKRPAATERQALQRPTVQAKAPLAPEQPIQRAIQSDSQPASSPTTASQTTQRPVVQAQVERAARAVGAIPDWPTRQRRGSPVSGGQVGAVGETAPAPSAPATMVSQALQRTVVQAQAERAARAAEAIPDWPTRQRRSSPVSGSQTDALGETVRAETATSQTIQRPVVQAQAAPSAVAQQSGKRRSSTPLVQVSATGVAGATDGKATPFTSAPSKILVHPIRPNKHHVQRTPRPAVTPKISNTPYPHLRQSVPTPIAQSLQIQDRGTVQLQPSSIPNLQSPPKVDVDTGNLAEKGQGEFDLEELVEKVQQRLKRRQAVEYERRGWMQWP